ncbi:MAG: hypothetical protein RLZZ308_261 [Candidatus Parcubacteria bacterium]|jgi:type II secretory pathway pseudopilin PulG
MKYSTSHNKKRIRGFTLLETLVSITIITLVIIGPLAFFTTSSSYARQTRETMVATYLAEEAIELWQNHYDSLYVYCKKQPSLDPCIPTGDETTGETAWRVFKSQIATESAYSSCFVTQNSAGCSFDFIDFLNSATGTPPRYGTTGNECQYLVEVSSSTLHSYVCKGVPTHISGTPMRALYKRTVKVERLDTFDGPQPEDQYNDDVRFTVDVSFRGVNGVTRSVQLVRYIHPRP